MDHLDLKNITLVMQDWVGRISLGYGVEHPDRIKHLVIMSTWAFDFHPEFADNIPQLFHFCRQPILGEGMLLGYNAFVEVFLFATIVRKERLTDEVMRAYRAPFPDYHTRIPTMDIQDVPLEADHPSRPTMKGIEAKLKNLNVPVLLCWGEDDYVLSSSHLFGRWKWFYPHAETALIPKASHFLQEDAPDEAVDNILKFMVKYR
jgi:pimeloyl-ACP methyl ester carboxylesterase